MPLLARSDFRDAARGLARTPAVTAAAILCFALGLGATTAVFSAINRALLQPPPYADAGRLVTVYRTAPQANNWPESPGNYLDLARATHQLSGLAAATFVGANGILRFNDQSLVPSGLRVTGNYFPLVGAQALHGRLLTPADDGGGAPNVMVISESFWRQQFGSELSAIGSTVRFKDAPYTIIGILPHDFCFVQGMRHICSDVWLPMRFSTDERNMHGSNYLMMLGRLAPSATVASADHELSSLFDGLRKQYTSLEGEGLRAVPLQAEAVRAVRTPMLLMFGAVAMVLLIAVSNVASLLLARGVGRRREMAVRAALGGSRWAMVRPMLAESVLLTGVGLAGGLALGWAAIRTVGATASRQIPQMRGVTLDTRVVLFAVGLAVLAALLCSVLPAWRASAVAPQDVLRAGGRGGSGRAHHRMLGAVVVAEVALSMVLLVGAALAMRGFASVLQSDPGFNASQLLSFDISVPPIAPNDSVGFRRDLDRIEAAIGEIPGVSAVGAIDMLPYRNWGNNFNIWYEGKPGDNPSAMPLVENREATPGFFAATQQRILAGRIFGPRDYQNLNAPVVVVNEALVKRDFKGRDPIGQRFHYSDTEYATIIGEVSDIKNVGPFAPPSPEAYFPFAIVGTHDSQTSMLVRVTRGDPASMEPAVRAALQRVEPQAALTDMRPMPDVISQSVGTPRFYLTLLATFAAVALALAITGLYGVMSYAVAQRSREIGIRNALGSPATRIIRLVGLQGAALVGMGLVLGLVGAVAASGLMRGLLYGVSRLDPSAWGLAALALLLAGLAASLVPALRAARVDPLVVMREE